MTAEEIRKAKTVNNFWKKIEAVKKAYAPVLHDVVNEGSDKVFKLAEHNLNGPYYGKQGSGPQTGQVPIPKLSTMLFHSLQQSVIGKWKNYNTLIAIYADERIAKWAKFVHDGTKYQRPRRFLQTAINRYKFEINRDFQNKILLAIRKEGLK